MPLKQALYQLPACTKFLEKKGQGAVGLLQALAIYSIDRQLSVKNAHIPPYVCVAHNIISRGDLCPISVELETKIAENIDCLHLTEQHNQFVSSLVKPKRSLYRECMLVLKGLQKNEPQFEFSTASQLIVLPIAIARIQKTLLDFIAAGELDLDKKSWNIHIVERDLVCAKLAIEDLELLFKNILDITDSSEAIPEIKLSVHRIEKPNAKKLANIDFDADLVIDIAFSNAATIDYPQENHVRIRNRVLGDAKAHVQTSRDKTQFSPNIKLLDYFSRRLLRRTGLQKQEQDLIKAILSNKSQLYKAPLSLELLDAYLIAAYLNPAFGLIVCGTESEKNFLQRIIKAKGIDTDSDLRSLFSNYNVLKIVCAADLHLASVRNNLEQTQFNLKHAFIYNIHRLSPFTDVFDCYYEGVIDLLSNTLESITAYTPVGQTEATLAFFQKLNLNSKSIISIEADEHIQLKLYPVDTVEEEVLAKRDTAYLNLALQNMVLDKKADALISHLKTKRWRSKVYLDHSETLEQHRRFDEHSIEDVLRILVDKHFAKSSAKKLEFIRDKERFVLNNKAVNQYLFNIPSSLESLYEMSRLQAPGLFFSKTVSDYRADHKVQKKQILTDQELILRKHYLRFKGPSKDRLMLSEILQMISYPDKAAQPGLLARLKKAELNESLKLRINFENNLDYRIQEISTLLSEKNLIIEQLQIVLNSGYLMDISLDSDLFKKSIRNASLSCTNLEDLIQSINDQYKIEQRKHDEMMGNFYASYIVDLKLPANELMNDHLKLLLDKIRRKEDTLNAIYILQLIGLVDDYVIIPEQNELELTFSKKEGQYYAQRYLNFIRNFIPETEAQQQFKQIPQDEASFEDSILVCCNLLINFMYGCVEPVRIHSHTKIVSLIEEIHRSENYFLLSEQFKQLKKARFANAYHQPNLVVDSDNGANDSLDLVWKYISLLAEDDRYSFMNNCHHLLDSTSILLESKSSQSAYLLLNAFCRFYLSSRYTKEGKFDVHNGISFDLGVDYFIEAMIHYSKDLNNQETMKILFKFKEELCNYKAELNDLCDQMIQLFWIEKQNRWLQDFNTDFLGTLTNIN